MERASSITVQSQGMEIGPAYALLELERDANTLADTLATPGMQMDGEEIQHEIDRMAAFLAMRLGHPQDPPPLAYSIFSIPELTALIFDNLGVHALGRARRVCRQWRYLIDSWKK